MPFGVVGWATGAPVGWNLTERHEAFFMGDRAQTGVGAETGERLSEARLQRRREVADAVVAGGTVEAVAGGTVFKQTGVERVTEAQRVGGATDPPEAALWGRHDLRPLGRHSSPGEERLGRHEHVAEVSLANALRRGLIVELRVQAEEPRTHGVGRLLGEQKLKRLVGAAQALLVLGTGSALAGCPARGCSGVGHSSDVRGELLSEHLLEVSDDVGDVRLDGLPVGFLWG